MTLGSVSVEAIQETGEILIFADNNGEMGCILLGKPLEGETILFEWSGLVWTVCYHVQPAWDVSSFESYLSPGTPGRDSPQKGTLRAQLHPPFLVL